MKGTLAHLLLFVLLLLIAATPAFAGGEQSRSENAQGSAVQMQMQDPPPFQP